MSEFLPSSAWSPDVLPEWLRLCAGKAELVASNDRLRGTNLSRRGTPIELMIDAATGTFEAEALAFFDWCVDVYNRLGWDTLETSE